MILDLTDIHHDIECTSRRSGASIMQVYRYYYILYRHKYYRKVIIPRIFNSGSVRMPERNSAEFSVSIHVHVYAKIKNCMYDSVQLLTGLSRLLFYLENLSCIVFVMSQFTDNVVIM